MIPVFVKLTVNTNPYKCLMCPRLVVNSPWRQKISLNILPSCLHFISARAYRCTAAHPVYASVGTKCRAPCVLG